MNHTRYSSIPTIQQENESVRMTTKWDKFRLLMWKNFMLQWRHKLQTVIEILIPVLFSALLVLIRSLVTPDIFPDDRMYPPLKINSLTNILDTPKITEIFKFLRMNNDNKPILPPAMSILYAPENIVLRQLMDVVQPIIFPVRISGVNSTYDLESSLIQESAFAGIEFPESFWNLTELPDKLPYALRFPGELRSGGSNPLFFNWRTDFTFPMFQPGGPRNFNRTDGGVPPGYYREGFLLLQHSIFRSFLKLKNLQGINIKPFNDVLIRRFPYPPFVLDILLQGLQTLVSLFILLSFVYPCINIVKYITTEKEKQLKEAMKIMGLNNWLHWLSWFIKCLIYMFCAITLMVVLLKIQWFPDKPVSVFTHSSASALWFFLLIYSITTIMFCFMLSVFFSTANVAAAVAGLVWFLIYSPFTFIRQRYHQISLAGKLASCLFSNTAMALGFDVIVRLEGTQEGFQWHNMFRPVTVDDSFTIGYVIVMLIFDAFLYLMIALYFEKIFPGAYGVAEKWSFPFTRKFWLGSNYSGIQDISANGVVKVDENFEVDPKNKLARIKINALRKDFGNDKVAVENLNLNMYEDQICVLLGHNGAGKTTTMSMLTGMISPTSGTALVNGYDIRTDIDSVRASIGLCPQHNILFDELTVREHIEFFGRLKGLQKHEINDEVEKYVKLLKLEAKIDCQAGSLSGGMKRKLSVGIALCADSKVVLVDEASSGMDPAARRALWDLLLQEKKGRTILLSTHFMDEADVLGDRIAIMAEGELKAVGSSFFLKKRFGVGYHLVCVKNSACETGNVTNLLRHHIDDIKVQTDIGTELSYLLDEKHTMKFQNMLEDLENNSLSIGIESYGISLTTMEEVFLKVGSDNQKKPVSSSNGHAHSNGHSELQKYSEHVVPAENFYNYSDALTLLEGSKLYGNQFIALMEKKILHTYRNWILLLIQILIPVSFIAITIIIVKSWGGNKDLPLLDLNLDTYQITVTTLETNPSIKESDIYYNISQTYRDPFNKLPNREIDVIPGDMNEHYLKKSLEFQARVNVRYLFGASINPGSITAWFSNQPYHAAPISLALVHNAILRTVCGPDCEIAISNKPLPYSAESRLLMLQAGNNLGFQLAFNIGFACAFLVSFYIIFYIKERITKAKLLQFVSGVNVFMYWLTAFLWDYFLFLIIAFLMVATIGAFQEDGFATFQELGRAYLTLILFGWAVLPVIYLSAQFFEAPATGFTKMSIIFIFLGVAMYTVVFSMKFDGFDLKHVAETLTWIFLTVPHFSLCQAFSSLNLVNVVTNVCDQQCRQNPLFCNPDKLCEMVPQCCNLNFWSWAEPGITRNLVYFVVVGLVSFIVLFLTEYRVIEYLYYKIRMVYRVAVGICCKKFERKPPVPNDTVELDSDVKQEKEMVNYMSSGDFSDYNLVMQNVTKFYGDFLAVNQLCTGIKHSECFGLLGINGAGKTSTFKMLTGDVKISFGEAFVQGISLKTNMKKVHQRIGYCPQFDALIDDLTGRETLRLFALCRGIPKDKLRDVIYKLSGDFNFIKHLDKQVKAYSGGNKRKLSTAVALLGNPVIVYLDEPTTGCDPGSKRNLWDVMCNVRESGKTIVLTSHSMEECEALCTRLAIMVNGEFKCLGSTQHLKNKFAQGFILTIKLKRKPGTDSCIELTEANGIILAKNKAKEFFEEKFPGVILKEEYFDMLTYNIPSKEIKWSEIFGTLEGAKQELDIEDYSIGQTSLEQIFLSFTKNQRNGDIE